MRAERGIEAALTFAMRQPSKNPAAAALYASVGFEKLHEIHDYSKSLT